MSKVLKKAKLRLARRTDNAPKNNSEMYNKPGSQNSHKAYPLSTGRRSKNQVHADSLNATSR